MLDQELATGFLVDGRVTLPMRCALPAPESFEATPRTPAAPGSPNRATSPIAICDRCSGASALADPIRCDQPCERAETTPQMLRAKTGLQDRLWGGLHCHGDRLMLQPETPERHQLSSGPRPRVRRGDGSAQQMDQQVTDVWLHMYDLTSASQLPASIEIDLTSGEGEVHQLLLFPICRATPLARDSPGGRRTTAMPGARKLAPSLAAMRFAARFPGANLRSTVVAP